MTKWGGATMRIAESSSAVPHGGNALGGHALGSSRGAAVRGLLLLEGAGAPA